MAEVPEKDASDESPVNSAQPQQNTPAQEQLLAGQPASSHGSSGEGSTSAMERLISQENSRRALPRPPGEETGSS
jgi:hypothetical protein